jgi:pimeloyl-ACP methyl ester carboxylesterase
MAIADLMACSIRMIDLPVRAAFPFVTRRDGDDANRIPHDVSILYNDRMRTLFSLFLLLISAGCATTPSASTITTTTPSPQHDVLKRRLALGAQLMPAPEGVKVGQLAPNGAAAASGLRTGDTIVAIAGHEVKRPEEIVAAMKQLSAGPAVFQLLRDGAPASVTVQLKEVPPEQSADYDVVYDSVRAAGALRRTIITKPHGSEKRPAVLFAGGIGCYSLDGAPAVVNGYIALIQELTRQGFVVMRVEKSSMGDSEGIPCQQQNFENELAGYRAGLAKLATYPYVDPSRIFLIGHSIGGIVAPVIASEQPLRGVVAMSTAGHRWLDYEEVNTRRQVGMEGKSGAELDDTVALHGRCARRFMIEGASPEAIVKDDPKCEEMIHYPAHQTYMQQIAALDPSALWKRVSAPVLLIHGASDFVTDRDEHEVIAAAVNATHPGNATVLIEPRMDHFMRDVESMDESMRVLKSNGLEQQPLQTQVRADIVAWLRAHS